MSSTTIRKTCITDAALLQEAVANVEGARFVGYGSHQMFSGTVTGYGVWLPEWRFPVVFNIETGESSSDNYSGAWGSLELLHKLQREYTRSVCLTYTKQHGGRIEEEQLANGELKLRIFLGGPEVDSDMLETAVSGLDIEV